MKENKTELEESFSLLNNVLTELVNCKVHGSPFGNPIDKGMAGKIEKLERTMTQMRKAIFPIIHPPRFKVGDQLNNERFESFTAPYRMIEYSGKVIKVEQQYWYMGMGNEKHGWEYSIYDENNNKIFEVADVRVLYSNTGVLTVS